MGLLVAFAAVVTPVRADTSVGHRTMPLAYAPYGNDFAQQTPPAGQTPVQRAHWLVDQHLALGQTPAQWIAWARALSRTAPAGASAGAAANVASAVARLDALAGVRITSALRGQILSSASRIPAQVRAPFTSLVNTVAGAYAAQLPVARDVMSRLRSGFDPHVQMLTTAERDGMLVRQHAILGALAEFRAQTARTFDALARSGRIEGPLFSDPEGLVILGGTDDNVYERGGLFGDPILLVDPSGSDTYYNSAGGACPVTLPAFDPGFGLGGPWMQCNGLAVSVVADLGDGTTAPSNDTYHYDGPMSAVQGAGGPGGLGILLDVAGDDTYYALDHRDNNSPFEPIEYYFDGGGQGFGYGGVGALIDGTGDDTYTLDVISSKGQSIWNLGQGFGGAGGVGALVDGMGNDKYLAHGLGLGQSSGRGGFEGIYTNGTGFYGGVGIEVDAGRGNDYYYAYDHATTVDFYAYGFGAFGGAGIIYDDGGDDQYWTYEIGDDPWINPLLNCAYGTASFGGIGIAIDVSGNDYYYGESDSPYGEFVMDNGWGGPSVAYGLFADTGGNDEYVMVANGGKPEIAGRGYYEPPTTGGFDPVNKPVGYNSYGTFVDIGGHDTYIPGGNYGADDSVWAFGIDEASGVL